MKNPECGNEIADDVKVCPSCGYEIIHLNSEVELFHLGEFSL